MTQEKARLPAGRRVADDVVATWFKRTHDWTERVLKGSLDPEIVASAVQSIIDGPEKRKKAPRDGQWFELEVDYDRTLPQDIIHDARHAATDWKYLGPAHEGRVRHLGVRLVEIEIPEREGFSDILRRLYHDGYIPLDGIASKAFREKFPQPTNDACVFFGKGQWRKTEGGPLLTLGLQGVGSLAGARWETNFYTEADLPFRSLWAVVPKS